MDILVICMWVFGMGAIVSLGFTPAVALESERLPNFMAKHIAGRRFVKLRRNVKFLVTAGVEGRVNLADVSYDSLNLLLLKTWDAFPVFETARVYSGSRAFFYGEDPFHQLAVVVRVEEEGFAVPRAVFMKQVFVFMGEGIAFVEAYENKGKRSVAQGIIDSELNVYKDAVGIFCNDSRVKVHKKITAGTGRKR